MSFGEIEGWIMDKTQEHFDEALEENAHVFKHLDPNNKGINRLIAYCKGGNFNMSRGMRFPTI